MDQKRKILLAEDASTMRMIEVKMLNDLGYKNVVAAKNGAEAIKKLQANPEIDFIISDWNMPEKSGLDVLIWARSQKEFETVPFLMATAQADKSQEHKAIDAGVSGFIPKPFEAAELEAKIQEILAGNPKEKGDSETVFEKTDDGKLLLKIAHIQITDHLVLGVLKHMLDQKRVQAAHYELSLQRFPGWNPVGQSLENRSVAGACILAPMAMDLFHFGVPLRIVLFAHRNGSIFVRHVKGDYQKPYADFFKGRSFLIPHKMSIHHMLSHLFLTKIGCHPHLEKGDEYDIEFEVAPPIQMPEFLKKSDKNAGFMVAEPIGSKAIAAGIANLQFLSGELWENHPCCVVALRREYVEEQKEAVQELTGHLIQAGKFIADHPDKAAEAAVSFLDPEKKAGLKAALIEKVLTQPGGITTRDLYPTREDLETMQQYMVNEMGVGNLVDLDTLLCTEFAETAYGKDMKHPKSKFKKTIPQNLLAREKPSTPINPNPKKKAASKLPLETQVKNLKAENKTLAENATTLANQLQTAENTIAALEEKQRRKEQMEASRILWQKRALGFLNNAAVALYEAEADTEAREVLHNVLTLDPENKTAKENLALLES